MQNKHNALFQSCKMCIFCRTLVSIVTHNIVTVDIWFGLFSCLGCVPQLFYNICIYFQNVMFVHAAFSTNGHILLQRLSITP